MNTRYTIRREGTLWEVRRPDGQRVSAYTLSGWHAAIYEAHVLSTADQIRDQKHRELFGPWDMLTWALQDVGRSVSAYFNRVPVQADYALAR